MPLAAFLSLVLEQRAANDYSKFPMKKAVKFGLITGLYAALFGSVFDIIITLITKQNDVIAMFPELQRMINSFPITADLKNEVLRLFQNVRSEILAYGFSPFYTASVILNNLIVNTIFGIVGGLIGAQIINRKINNTSE